MNFPNNYYHAMDRGYFVDDGTKIEGPIELTMGDKSWNVDLGLKEVGTSLNPFQHQLQALNAKIKEGASKVEFEFFGTGKGNKERATPESFDAEERREMRNLAKINEVTTSTHATVGVEGLAGFNPQRGFDEQARDTSIREVKKAIDFAAEASTGGAIVLHTGEWTRPIYDTHHEDVVNGEEYSFTGYAEEDKKAPIMVVDGRTGELNAMRKDTTTYEPKFKTVADYEKETGKNLVGKTDKFGNLYEADDWIGIKEEAVKRDWEFDTEKASMMFARVPVWNSKKSNFETTPRDWKYFQARAEEWNNKHKDNTLSPEEIFAKTQYMNQILQSKGSSLYYAQRYENEYDFLKSAREALKFYEKLDKTLPKSEKKKLMTEKTAYSKFVPTDEVSIKEYLEREVNEMENRIRHIHEASAAADVQTQKAEDAMKKVMTVKDYGLKQSANSMAELGMHVWQKNEKNKKDLKEDLYLAPENWHPNQFGSHPDELLELVKAGRQEMVNRLKKLNISESKAKELAKKHIKTTFDSGHLNLWKSHLKRKDNESEEAFNKRFSNWTLGKLEELHKEGALGHIHLTDNFGYDDEHLNLGKGNAPVKEIVGFLKDKGYKDFIVEPGSFNAQTILPDAMSRMGSPVYRLSGVAHGPRFTNVHQQHFGYQAPPLYVVGAYSPVVDDKTWSEVQLE